MKKKTFGILKFLLMACFTNMLADCNGQTKQQNIKRDAITNTKNRKSTLSLTTYGIEIDKDDLEQITKSLKFFD